MRKIAIVGITGNENIISKSKIIETETKTEIVVEDTDNLDEFDVVFCENGTIIRNIKLMKLKK